jgi:glutamate--cysteine ligase catalytic subunit
MGFISDGTTLTWQEAQQHIEYVKKHGILQFLNIYRRTKNRANDRLFWGDEIEYIIAHVDHEKKVVQVDLRAHDVLEDLMTEEKENTDPPALWRPEYGRYMIEGTPGKPYSGLKDICLVEDNMKLRRRTIAQHLQPDEMVISMTSFPRLGCPGTVYPSPSPNGPIAKSSYLPDAIINPHPRFGTLTANIRERRTSKVDINIPLFRDTNTNPLADVSAESPKPYNIHMDAMGFGMGCCCLQCTFQCCNLNEARHFYDQLAIMAPIMMALSAAAPIYKGLLANIDARWTVISQSVDDRTPEERGLRIVNDGKHMVISKSRYDSIDCFLSADPALNPRYNDLPLQINQESYSTLIAAGVDELLARHVAHLFIRDPLVIYSDKIELDDEQHSDHFENIQSTNWQTVRLKPPPPGSTIGWRVEFRSMEVQLTDFENAAYVAFIVLLTRVLTVFELNLYIPISRVDENMARAHHCNAVMNERFYFRKNITSNNGQNHVDQSDGESSEYTLMTINEIMNGKADEFPGLINMINVYLDSINLDSQTRSVISKYLSLISKRASGELMTAATWMRHFVQTHPSYKHDSVVGDEIAYDLALACQKISTGELVVPLMLGDFVITA